MIPLYGNVECGKAISVESENDHHNKINLIDEKKSVVEHNKSNNQIRYNFFTGHDAKWRSFLISDNLLCKISTKTKV